MSSKEQYLHRPIASGQQKQKQKLQAAKGQKLKSKGYDHYSG
jgi:hypothetical protein